MGRHPSSDSRSSISSVSTRSGPSFSRSRSQNTMNSGTSRSSRGSRSSRSGRNVGSTRRGQRIKSDIYRRHALINSTRRRIAKEQNKTVFQMRSKFGVASRREVAVVDGNVTIKECTVIYHAQLTEDELNKAMRDVMEKHKDDHQIDCLEKRLKMRTFYGKEMIVIERELRMKKNDLGIPFENGEEHHNGSIAKQEDSRSDVSLLAGYSVRSDGRNFTFEETLKISFDRGGEENLTRRNSTYRVRKDEPNSEETTQIKETLFADENTMVLSCIFDLQSISQDVSIAEFREYVYNTCELKELTIIHPTPGHRRNLDNTVFFSFNESNKSIGIPSAGSSGSGLYESAQSRISSMDSRKKSISHQEALQSPRSPRPSLAVSPRLILPQVVPERRRTSALSSTAPANLPNAPQIVNVTMGQIRNTTILDHHHLLKLYADIDGNPYEFVAKITFQAAPGVNFVPRRVMLDSNVLWQHSSEWNPTTSVSSSQANMSIEHSKTLPN